MVGLSLAPLAVAAAPAAAGAAAKSFHRDVEPLLTKYCSDCHADGMKKGNVAFDELGSDEALLAKDDLWFAVLKNVRAGIMPPPNKPRPSAEEQKRLFEWIKYGAFGIDPKNIDPGRVTVRRLNRIEYRNTIRDLMGVEFNTEGEFPPDDTGHGFDNIGDVLTISPMLLEKYLAAARTVVAEAVPAGKPAPKRFFEKEIPAQAAERRAYATELLENFARKAFRRPVDKQTVDRLAALAESVYKQTGKTFEAGVAHAMVAVLASPRFIFREEGTLPSERAQRYPLIDEYSLASRLSYFLWSSMPDEELFRLAAAGELRKNLPAQVKRMLADSRSKAFIQNFTGQWLRARDIETVVIEARDVLRREDKVDPERDRRRARFRELRNKPDESLTEAEKEELAKMREDFRRFANPRAELTGELRRAMRRETEKYFEHIIRENRPLEELIDSDYTFLNERLAKHYGIDGVTGDELRLVKLPADSPRGGILSQGTVLAVTSNPTRTSPVKRGVFILDNILGTPPPPPPPDIPPLEDAAKEVKGREPTLRETLELHRREPLCSGCHNRMDPLGLAMENFNAMGMWREQERDQKIEVSGKLISGEPFTQVKELKRILATDRRTDFYRCLTEKLLTYALGRGIEHHDAETVDKIVGRLESGRFEALLMGVVESDPFQKRRSSAMVAEVSNK